jgi:hypothetical protein
VFARSISTGRGALPGLSFLVAASLLVVAIGVLLGVVRRQQVPAQAATGPA